LYPLADPLLDDFLRLADTHGSFGECLVTLAALQAKTRTTLPCGEQARLASMPDATSATRAVACKIPTPTPLPADLQPKIAALVAAVADRPYSHPGQQRPRAAPGRRLLQPVRGWVSKKETREEEKKRKKKRSVISQD
jgi:hypothetical protein